MSQETPSAIAYTAAHGLIGETWVAVPYVEVDADGLVVNYPGLAYRR